jgi:hypothetical protein
MPDHNGTGRPPTSADAEEDQGQASDGTGNVNVPCKQRIATRRRAITDQLIEFSSVEYSWIDLCYEDEGSLEAATILGAVARVRLVRGW